MCAAGLLLAGCGQQGTPAVSAPGSAVSTVTSTVTTTPPNAGRGMGGTGQGPMLPANAEPVSGSRVDASALPNGYPREVWTIGDGHQLGLYGDATGGCQSVSAKVTAQTTSQVTVDEVVRSETGTASCPMTGMRTLTVTLDQPLGSRTVRLELTTEQG